MLLLHPFQNQVMFYKNNVERMKDGKFFFLLVTQTFSLSHARGMLIIFSSHLFTEHKIYHDLLFFHHSVRS